MKNNTEITIYNLIEYTLKAIPEIKLQYEDEAKWYQSAYKSLTKQDLEELNTIATIHNIPQTNDPIGETIVFENMVSPFIASLAPNSQQRKRLEAVMIWIEGLANSKDKWVRNIVAGSVCEPLLTTYRGSLKDIIPYMGEMTKQFCRMQFEQWKLSKETKLLFE